MTPLTEGGRGKAWAAFQATACRMWGKKSAETIPIQAEINKQWDSIRAKLFPDRDEDSMGLEDWLRFAQEGPEQLVPF